MWGRVVEMAIAVWLALSPFIFRVQHDARAIAIDFGLSTIILLFASLSYYRPTRYAHLLTLVVAVGMLAWGRFAYGSPPPPIEQNHIFVGFLLLMIALIPSEASLPPEPWRQIKHEQ